MRRASSIIGAMAAALANEPANFRARRVLPELPRRTPAEEPEIEIAPSAIEVIEENAKQRRIAKAQAKRERKAAKHARMPVGKIDIDAIVDDTLYDHNVHQRVRRG
jgi:hypothetical protein